MMAVRMALSSAGQRAARRGGGGRGGRKGCLDLGIDGGRAVVDGNVALLVSHLKWRCLDDGWRRHCSNTRKGAAAERAVWIWAYMEARRR